jgi:hypothetical protein
LAQLTYGLKDNKLYHIDEVEQGLKCDCTCPNCNEKLIARQGEINEHHFAHTTKECDITIAQETALHYIAKSILEEYKIIRLPTFNIHNKSAFLGRKIFKELDHRINKESLINTFSDSDNQELVCRFDKVLLEHKQKDIIPDLYCEYGDKKLLIEIAVTNFINETKSTKIKEQQIDTIEINLSEYKDKIETLTKHRLADILIDEIELKKWIYNSQYNDKINEIIVKNQENIENQLKNIQYCCDLFLPENYVYNQYRYTDERHAQNFWNKQTISKRMSMPWYINMPIYGDFIFNIDRHIWQSFILNLTYISKYPTNPKNTWNYMKDKEFLRIDQSFINPTWISNNLQYSGLDVVTDYYQFLQSNKIITKDGLFNG